MNSNAAETPTVWCVAPMSIWSAAWLWSAVVHPDGPEAERVYLANALAVNARHQLGLNAEEVIPGPGPLGALSLWNVLTESFNPPVRALTQLIDVNVQGCKPRRGETGHAAWLAELNRLDMDGLRPADIKGDPEREERLRVGTALTERALAGAENALTAAISADPDNVMLARLADRLDAYLAEHPPVTDDQRYRAVLGQVGWVDGRVPAGLIEDAGPWCRVGFGPSRPGETWCAWLVATGWAQPYTDDLNDGVSMVLPRDEAETIWAVGNDYTQVGSVRPAPKPPLDILISRYGDTTPTV